MTLDAEALGGLLAYCVACSVDMVQHPHHRADAVARKTNRLAAALSLDMTQHWTPTVGSYFGRVSKAQCLAAVQEACGDAAAARLAGLKKPDMAAAAEQAVAGTGWLPSLLRTPPLHPAIAVEDTDDLDPDAVCDGDAGEAQAAA